MLFDDKFYSSINPKFATSMILFDDILFVTIMSMDSEMIFQIFFRFGSRQYRKIMPAMVSFKGNNIENV